MKRLIEVINKNNRICPQPLNWNELHGLLPNTKRVGVGYEPPIPLILGAWHNTSDEKKKERLLVHIKWAEENGCSGEIMDFLQNLKEEEWYHKGE